MSGEQRVTDELLACLLRDKFHRTDRNMLGALEDLRDERTTHRATEAKLTAALAEVERLHAKLHEATIDSGPMLGESMGAALGNAIAGYRDRDMKRAAAGLVAAVHILRRLEDDRDKFRWQVRDTCTRAEAAESALAATEAEVEQWKAAEEKMSVRFNNAVHDHMAAKDRLEAAREAHFSEAARIASTWCLVPPDGGSPSEEEADLCDTLAAHFRSLAALTTQEAPDATR